MNTSTGEPATITTHEFTLENGLRVIVREDHRKPEIYSTVEYGVGESHEGPEDWGITSAVSSALFGDYKQESSFAREVGGSSLNMGGETINQEFRLPREHLESAFGFQSALMARTPDDDAYRVALEREVLSSKRPSTFISVVQFSPALDALVETGTSYYRPADGITETLERLTVAQARQWREMWFGPNNAVLSVAGDVTADEVRALASQYFANIARCELPDRPIVRGPTEPGYRKITQSLDTKCPLMLISFNIPSITTSPNCVPVWILDLISALLSGKAPVHLADNGLDPARMGSVTPIYRRGNSRLHFGYTFEGDADEAEASFWRLLETFKDTLLRQSDIDKAIDAIRTEQQAYNDDIEKLSRSASALTILGCPWQLMDSKIAELDRVTATDIQSIARTYLTRERATVGHIFPLQS